MRFTLVNSTDGLFHVHLWGCRDLDREMRNANGQYIAEADNVGELIPQEIRNSDVELPEENFLVFPCCYRGTEHDGKITRKHYGRTPSRGGGAK